MICRKIEERGERREERKASPPTPLPRARGGIRGERREERE